MNEDEAVDVMQIGVNLGIFTTLQILLSGPTLDRKLLQAVSDLCSLDIEEKTGIPAEDFALKVQPAIDQFIKTAKGKI